MNTDDKIFEFAYKMAFRDATMRNAFSRREGEDVLYPITEENKR